MSVHSAYLAGVLINLPLHDIAGFKTVFDCSFLGSVSIVSPEITGSVVLTVAGTVVGTLSKCRRFLRYSVPSSDRT